MRYDCLLCADSIDRATDSPRFARVFSDEDVEISLLQGRNPERLMRWNGPPGTVAQGALEGPGIERADGVEVPICGNQYRRTRLTLG
jgi:hypothetical protein